MSGNSYDNVVSDSISYLNRKVDSMDTKLTTISDSQIEMKVIVSTLQRIVYGAIGFILISVLGALIYLVLPRH